MSALPRAGQATDYLRQCLALFGETMQERHGWRPDYEGLEQALAPVATGQREFSYRDLETIQNGRFWDFRQFWRFPAESDIVQEIDLAGVSRLLSRLPLDEEQAIARMHAGLKYIQNVSIVLRFVKPRHYGIISPPVEKVLEVRRGRDEVETYLNYLRDIRDLADHHGLGRAADADMALWVLQERVLSSFRDPGLLSSFRADTWLLRRKAVNLLAELADVEDHLELARALVEVHVPLAGVLAGAELERRLRARMAKTSRSGAGGALDGVIAALAATEAPAVVSGWRLAQRVRDRFLQPGERPTRAETLDLIEQAQRLEGGDTT
jgi:hypothetical protein